MRAYATTIPMSLYIVVTSGGVISEFIFRKHFATVEENTKDSQLPMILSSTIILASFIIPVILKQIGTPPSINPTKTCKPGVALTLFVIPNGSSMTINGEVDSTYIPAIEQARFMNKLLSPDQLADGAAISLMAEMESGSTLTLVRWVATESEILPSSPNGILITRGVPQPGSQTLCVAKPLLGSYYLLPEEAYEQKSAPVFRSQILNTSRFVLNASLWFIFFFVLIKSARIFEFPNRVIPIAAVNIFLIASGILLFLHITGIFSLSWEHQEIEADKSRNPEGFMYIYNIGTEKLSDTKYWDYPSYLYENNALLAQPHESQSLISEYGRGRYILREKALFFSTSDNSDPKDNKRLYTLEYPMEIRIRYQVVIFSLAIISWLVHMLYFMPMIGTIRKEMK
jgi:hypothetical protein